MSESSWWGAGARRGMLVVAALALAAAVGCGQGTEVAEEPVAAEPTVLEDAELGLAVVVPPGSPFEPVPGEDGEIRLRFPGNEDFSEGTVIYAAEPEQYFGVNLVEAVNEREVEVEERPQGEFLGQVELGHEVLGTAYSTRSRHVEDGRQIEEIRIFAVHPTGNRLLHMTYRYEPAPGQTQARMMDQAFEAFGYLEPLSAENAEPQEGAGEGTGEGAEESGATGSATAGEASTP